MSNYLRFALACVLAAGAALAGAQTGRLPLQIVTLQSGATATGAGTAAVGVAYDKTYQVTGATTAGAGSATVAIQCSGNGTNWDTLGTVTLTLSTTSSSNSFSSADRCYRVRSNVTAISGTGAAVSATMGY